MTGKVNNLVQLFNAEEPSTVTKVGNFGGNGGAIADFGWRRAIYRGYFLFVFRAIDVL